MRFFKTSSDWIFSGLGGSNVGGLKVDPIGIIVHDIGQLVISEQIGILQPSSQLMISSQPPSAKVDGLWANTPVLSIRTTICIDTDDLLKQPQSLEQ